MLRNPLLHSGAALLALASAVFPNTIIVDDDGGPGVAFLDLPPAIAAAQPGDLLLVQPGSYTEISLHFSLTILGLGPGVRLASGSRVSALPAGARVTLAGLEVRDLRVLGCAGTVVLDGLSWYVAAPFLPFPEPSLLVVRDSADVRVILCSVPGGSFNSAGTAVTASGATRLELVQSTLLGREGSSSSCGPAGDGWAALVADGGARVHAALSACTGGKGGDQNTTCIDFCSVGGAGDGGAGALASGSTLLLMGSGPEVIRGGMTGIGEVCNCDGYGGPGIASQSGAIVRYSGVAVVGGSALSDCLGHTGQPFAGPANQAVPPEPALELSGMPVSGSPAALRLFGPPGSKATIYLGTSPLVVATPGVDVEILCTRERTNELGTIPANGSLSFPLALPTAKGSTLYVQAEVVTNGVLRRTNSLPLVLR